MSPRSISPCTSTSRPSRSWERIQYSVAWRSSFSSSSRSSLPWENWLRARATPPYLLGDLVRGFHPCVAGVDDTETEALGERAGFQGVPVAGAPDEVEADDVHRQVVQEGENTGRVREPGG